MKGKQSIKLRYILLALVALFIVLTFYYGQSFEEAIYTERFPIPPTAKISKISSLKLLETYQWEPASEENGLPLRYKLMIRLSGWKEIDRMGALTTYKKGNLTVDVVSYNNRIELYGKQ